MVKDISTHKSLFFQIPILNTKLHIPPKPTVWLSRPRLHDKLKEISGKKVIALSAPAGFGKTALISEWIRHTNLPAGWVSLEYSENDPMRFWEYVFAALESANPVLSRNSYGLLESVQLSSVESIVVPFIQEISKLPSNLILVLDDFHVIEDPQIHRAISYLIRHLPDNLKLVFVSRAELPVRLHRLRLEDQIVELGAEDLRFTREEVETFFNQLNALNLSVQELKSLEKYTEGWGVGMQLLALSMGKSKNVSGFIKSFSGSQMYIAEYLTEEVLNHHSPATKEFLLKTSILERMCGSLCQAVTEETNAAETLAHLYKENSFIVPLDDEEHWYRYHHLFGSLLKRRLLEEQGENVCHLHDRAAHWLEKHGYIQEAIHHSFAAKNYQRATALIDKIAPHIVKKRGFSTVKTWIGQFPEKWLDTHPDLCVISAWVFALTGRYSKAESTLVQAEEYVNETKGRGFHHVLVEIDVIRGYLSMVQKDAEKAVHFMRNSISREPKYSRFFQFGMVLNPGEPCLLQSDLGLKGRLTKVSAIYPEFRKIWKYSGLPIVGHGSVILGELYYEWNQLEDVNYFVNRGMQLGEDNQNIGILMPIYFIHANMKRIQNKRAEMWALIDDIERILEDWKVSPHWREVIDSYKAKLFIEEGRVEKVRDWLRTCGMTNGDKIIDATEYQYIIYARALRAVGESGRSIQLMDKLIDRASAEDRLATTIKLLFVKSFMFFNDGMKKKAYELLDASLNFAEPEGYVRTFLDEGVTGFKLLEQYHKHHTDLTEKQKKYLQHLLHHFREELGPKDRQSKQCLVEPLTQRELDVLALLNKGLSNGEIANTLYISVGTVKGYNHNIYAKLQVKNRTQALLRAQEMDLIS